MPIAELLGVQLDMQLLLKLGLSAAGVLLVSWAYRFYSARASRAKACLPSAAAPGLPPDGAPPGAGDPPDGRRGDGGRAGSERGEDGRGLRERRRPPLHSAHADADGRTPPVSGAEPPGRAGAERAAGADGPARENGEGGAAAAARRRPLEGSTRNVSVDSDTLNPPGPREGAPGEAGGRRSPRFLQRLERSVGSVGVGRELWQDVDHQGAQSSFLSKAEVQVEDTHLVLEGSASDRVVHGKIYDYYVESSHSMSESKPVFRHNARTSSPDSRSVFRHTARTSSPDSRSVFRHTARTSSPDSRSVFRHNARTSSPDSRSVFRHTARTSSPDSRSVFRHTARTSSPDSRSVFRHNARTSSPDSRSVFRHYERTSSPDSRSVFRHYERASSPDSRSVFRHYERASSLGSSPLFGHNARTSSPDSRRVQLGEIHRGGGGGGGGVVSVLSPIIMRDLALGRSAPAPLSPATPPPESGPPAKPPLLRKESYLSATEHSQLPIPCLTPGASPPGSPPQAGPHEEPHSVGAGIRGPAAPAAAARRPREDPGLETRAGAPFVHLPAKRLNRTDLEGLKSKLDLGNCMEVLGLAKLCGDEALKAAALRVMSDNYLQVLREPALYGRLMACERELIQRLRARGRRCVMVADMDPQDGAEGPAAPEQRRTSSSLYYYDDRRDAWHALCPVPREVVSRGCALCTMDNYLFVAVGCQGSERDMVPSKRVFCFNPVTSIWKEISPMNQARPRCRLAAAGGCLYAIGGECLSTVERYDPRADRWAFVASLPNDTFAVGHRAAVCNGDIYITGGTLRYALLRYAPAQDAWRPGVVVGSGDPTVDMAAVGSFLYRFEANPRLGVSAYRYHAVARLWYLCGTARPPPAAAAPAAAPAAAFRCVASGDSVYCVGRRFAVRFDADEISPAFCGEPLAALPDAKGVLFPFVLSLPDKEPVQTSV